MRDSTVDTARDDIGELYAALAVHVRQIVKSNVRWSDEVIDDACQIAWSRLLGRRRLIRRESLLTWLVTTATRETFRLSRRTRGELPLHDFVGKEDEPIEHGSGPDRIAELRSRLDALTELPVRQQRLLWLQGFGLSYVEMAGYTSATTRTVERQLMRARGTLRAA